MWELPHGALRDTTINSTWSGAIVALQAKMVNHNPTGRSTERGMVPSPPAKAHAVDARAWCISRINLRNLPVFALDSDIVSSCRVGGDGAMAVSTRSDRLFRPQWRNIRKARSDAADPTLVARVTFSLGQPAVNALAEAIPKRRVVPYPYWSTVEWANFDRSPLILYYLKM